METLECIKTRRSVREYEERDVPNDIIGIILEAATFAPSAGNLQPWEFVVVKERKKREALYKASYYQEHVRDAPVVIVVCADLDKASSRYGFRGKNLYCIQDTAAAIQNILLAAHDIGLGTCWVGAFDEEDVKLTLGLPDNLRPVALITIGYPKEIPKMPKRIPVSSISWLDEYKKVFGYEPKTTSPLSIVISEPLGERVKKIKPKIKKRKIKIDPMRFVKFVKKLAK